MYRGRKHRFDWTFSLSVGDFLAVALSFPAAFLLWWEFAPPETAPSADRVTLLNCIFFGALILGSLRHFGAYRWSAFVRFRSLTYLLPGAVSVAAVIFMASRFLVSDRLDIQYLPFLGVHCLICTLLLAIGRGIVRLIDLKIVHGVSIERIAVVGWSERIERVLRSLQAEMRNFQQVVGFFHADEERPEDSPAFQAGLKPLGPISKFEEVIEKEDITLVLTEQGRVRWKELRDIIAICADAMVSLRVIPSAFDVWANRLSVRVLGGIPVMGINDLHHDRYINRFLKRALDIVCASFGLIVSAPIIAVLAILIRRESPGPIFYRQTRLGLHDKPFQIIKLRSMRVDAEKETGAVWAVGDDPRRLKIGAFMRSWNLDELPQFWNVLKGEMSMVGPRPERPEFVEGFRDTVRYYNLRHTCKPGVTGWAAVHGLRGNTSLEDRLEYDLYYIENWSLALDIRIMLMTLAPPKNAY